jgi:hypothetical protein
LNVGGMISSRFDKRPQFLIGQPESDRTPIMRTRKFKDGCGALAPHLDSYHI